jgi:sterol desaturase/sphingolipid hydroxylase (fatty acid hydroxylase superfamily)
MEIFHFVFDLYKNHVPFEIRRYIWVSKGILLSPYPYLIALLAVVLNHIRPVTKNLKSLLIATAQDFIWFQTDTLFQLTVMPVYAGFLKVVYDRYFSFLTQHFMDSWPLVFKFIFAFLVYDFAQWLHHFIRHKIIVLWYFHTVHHAQRHMTLFTDLRVHPMEYLVARGITFIILFMMQADPFIVVGVGLVLQWYTRLYHADIKTNYGPLKYILVTPQSHRIHHSVRPEHYDKNFGVVFTIWDRIFGTLYKNYEEYPETGIPDEDFPHEAELSISLVGNYLRQLAYPFQRIFRPKKNRP